MAMSYTCIGFSPHSTMVRTGKNQTLNVAAALR